MAAGRRYGQSAVATNHITLCASGNSVTPVLVATFNAQTSVYVPSGSVNANAWNFFGYTVCCSGGVQLIQNLTVNGTTTSVAGGTYSSLTVANTYVGYGVGTFANYFQGKIDDFRYYGRVLCSMEMRVLYGYAYGKSVGPSQVSAVVPSLGSVTVGTNQATIPITFSTNGTFSYVQIARTMNGVTISSIVNASQLVASGNSYVWTDAAVVQGTYYTYKVTPFILGTPGISSTPSTAYVLFPPTAISVVGTSISTTSFSLVITGGTNAYSTVTYTYNINGQGYGVGYTVSPGSTSQTPTITLNNGTGLYAAPRTVIVQATNAAGSVISTASASFFPPPVGVSVAGWGVGNGTDISHFTLAITGGTSAYSTVNYTYNINGQGFNAGYTTSNTTSQSPTVTITNGGIGSYAPPWTVVVRATDSLGQYVVSTASASFVPPPTGISSVVGTGTDATHFTLAITGGTSAYSVVTYTYNINSQGFGVGYTTSSSTSQTPTVTLTSGTGVYAAPWTVIVRASNSTGQQDSNASSPFNFFPKPIIQYKFDTGDQVGLNLYNWATGLYDASFTAANMVSTTRFSTGSASCYFDGTNSITIKPAIVYTNANALAAGFNATGWTPKNTLGYTFTTWYYNTVDWGAALFEFIYSSDHTVGVVPGDRCSFGASNYSPPPGWGANGLALNTWMFFAIVFPAGSVSTSIQPTLYVYGNGADTSYNVSCQVTSEGTLGVYNYTTLNLGSNVGVAYVAGNKNLTGYYDDFRMYAVALNSTQIHAIINKTA